MTPDQLIRRLIVGLIAAAVVGLIWWLAVSRSFLQLTLANGADAVQVADGKTGLVVAQRTNSGWLNLPTGSYLITFTQGGHMLDTQARTIGPFSFQHTTAAGNNSPSQKAQAILKYPADLVTPLAGGYLYLDMATRGLSFARGGTVQDLTGAISLTANSNLSLAINTTPIANALINLQSVSQGGVVATTTHDVFWIHSLTNIVPLPLYPKTTLNLTSSAYDAKTNALFVTPTYSSDIYRYDLSNPNQEPTLFYHGARQFNRLVAGGGRVIAYYDSVATTDPQVVADYGRTRQVELLMIDASNGASSKTLSGFAPVTHVSISASGQYLAIKRKFAATLTIYTVSSGRTVTLPSFDIGGIAWQQDTLMLARDQAIWTYDATNQQAMLTKLAAVDAPVTNLSVTSDQVILSTNEHITSLLQPTSSTTQLPVIKPPSPPNVHYTYFAPPAEK